MNLLLSLIAILAAAWVLARLLRPTGLPPLLGMIVAGALVANLLPGDLLPLAWPGGTLQVDDVSGWVRKAVLAVVLLRAGLGLSRTDMRAAGTLALRLAFVPMLFDAALIALCGVYLLDLRPLVAVALGFTLAAISPAIVIPGVLEILGKREGRDRRAPTALLAGAPLDNVACLVALGVALDLATGEKDPSWGALALAVPLHIGGGIFLGWLAGEVVGRFMARFVESPVRGAVLLWLVAGGLIAAGEALGVSFVLAIIAMGAVVRAQIPGVSQLGALIQHLGKIWNVIQYALFGLIGAALDLGPLAEVGLLTAVAVCAGQLGRAAGALLATVRSGLTLRERGACVLAYVPKATIQAAFGGYALDRGLAEGELILNAAVLAIVICAPIGVVTLTRGADALLPGGKEEATACPDDASEDPARP